MTRLRAFLAYLRAARAFFKAACLYAYSVDQHIRCGAWRRTMCSHYRAMVSARRIMRTGRPQAEQKLRGAF